MNNIISIIGLAILGLVLTLVVYGLVALVAAIPVMLLWNAIIPFIFTSVPAITYWQSVGLFLLTSLLFRSYSTSSSD